MHRPITQTMAEYLQALINGTPVVGVTRTAEVLERRGCTARGVISQKGREVLGQYHIEQGLPQVGAITNCIYFNTFYGWKGFLTYADNQRNLIKFKFRLPSYHHNLEIMAQRAVLHELTKVRSLSLDCTPQMVEEPIDDYDEE